MTISLKALAIVLAMPVLLLADLAPEAPLGLRVVREANAIVGAPLTPMSVAGVARRTTRRTVYATSAVAASNAAAASSATTQQQQATAQQQQAVAQQQQATAQQQAATAQQQAAIAQQQAAAAAGAPPIGHTVSALPAGCVSTPINGVQYFNCAGVYYRPAFQSNNLVYVVTQP